MFDILSKIQETGPYRPRIKDVRLWFSVINEIVFKGKVPKFKYIHIGHKRGQFAACVEHHNEITGKVWCDLEMDEEFKDFAFFLAVLAHEMVHAYQVLVLGRPMSHGKYFWAWKKKFNKHKLPLAIYY
jgi:hypothetical protein